MNDLERRKREILSPLLIEAGAGLFDCQGFEYGISLLLFHFSRLGAEGLDPARMQAILDGDEKKTAGQLIVMLKRHVSVSEGLETALRDALAARNKLVHRMLIDNVERIPDRKERSLLVKEIRGLRRAIEKGDELIRPLVEALSQVLDGLHAEPMRTQAITKLFETAAESPR